MVGYSAAIRCSTFKSRFSVSTTIPYHVAPGTFLHMWLACGGHNIIRLKFRGASQGGAYHHFHHFS